ncbi:hypothetical protein BZA77DRAFT_323391 [Pyronema omphalodes]|nr:hypothetical protein BZA77DRAFT_323391 [Pyronema omphalodes]
MLLASHPIPRHTRPRHRPKLSLQIATYIPSPINSARTPSSALSPTSRNTAMNRRLTQPSPSPTGSSSSSSSDDDCDNCGLQAGETEADTEEYNTTINPEACSLKDKHRLRRHRQQRRERGGMKSSHHPTTPSASFLPTPQPGHRGRTLIRKTVGFCDEVVVHYIEIEEEEEIEQGPSAMEKAMELERLKKWVEEMSPDAKEEERGLWVRRLVELEMKGIED